jgi:hypothetical protein
MPERAILPPRSQVERLCEPGAFLWATGIEDTVITDPWPRTGRTLDEYALTGHDRHWRSDFALMARLGVRTARYGIPWHRVNPAPGRWDWAWVDRRLDRLADLGIEPIIDLLHYGLPSWLEGAFLARDFPQRFSEFATRLFARSDGRLRWYTPVNEPRITAWYCGKLGWWPPYRRGWRGFVAVLLALSRATATAVQALRAIDKELVDVHVEATDVYSSPDPALAEEVAFRRRLVFLGLDLTTGRVDRRHPLHTWLLRQGAPVAELEWLREHRVAEPALIGINLYPQFSNKVIGRGSGTLRIRQPYGTGMLVEEIARTYWRRFRRPLMISETASNGSPERRQRWLDDSVAAVRRLRRAGIPLVGYTWWPMFALVTWAYRQGDRAAEAYLVQMGLWDLAAAGGALRRVPTRLVPSYAALAHGGTAAVGDLEPEPTHVR